jgi:LemA protein
MGTVIVIAIVLVLLVAVAVIYNRLVRQRNRIDNAWAQVDVQLKRRYDLIPNLIETVKGYAAHEQETFDSVVAARTQAVEAGNVEQQGAAENMLTGALRQLFALSEDYPELRAAENFQALQEELAATESKTAVSRQIYNDTTLTYNNSVQTIPSNLVAAATGFKARPYFEAEDEARTVPKAEF